MYADLYCAMSELQETSVPTPAISCQETAPYVNKTEKYVQTLLSPVSPSSTQSRC